jgi:hypothetical protein
MFCSYRELNCDPFVVRYLILLVSVTTCSAWTRGIWIGILPEFKGIFLTVLWSVFFTVPSMYLYFASRGGAVG